MEIIFSFSVIITWVYDFKRKLEENSFSYETHFSENTRVISAIQSKINCWYWIPHKILTSVSNDIFNNTFSISIV